MTTRELKELIFECYCNVLTQRANKALVESENKEEDMVFAENGEVLPDTTEQILAKFPTLKHCIERLQSNQYMEFIANIEWISPRPTIFRINLKNGQSYMLTWMGKDFEAEIAGKKYYLGKLVGYQQALRKLSILYQEGPMKPEDSKEGESIEQGGDFGGMSGGGDFPGANEQPSQEEPSGSEEGAEGEGEDLGGENIDFEADKDI